MLALKQYNGLMRTKGINYDVGTEMGVNWRPDYNPQTVEQELADY